MDIVGSSGGQRYETPPFATDTGVELPPELWANILSQMSLREVAQTGPASRSMAVERSRILERTAAETLDTLCPRPTICWASLFCAIVHDRAYSVDRVAFSRVIRMADLLKRRSWRSTVNQAPCRAFESGLTSLSDSVGIGSDPEEVFTAADLAVRCGAP